MSAQSRVVPSGGHTTLSNSRIPTHLCYSGVDDSYIFRGEKNITDQLKNVKGAHGVL